MEGQIWKLLEHASPQDSEDPEIRAIYARKLHCDIKDNNSHITAWGKGQKLSLTLGSDISSEMLKPSYTRRQKELHASNVFVDYIAARGDPKALSSTMVDDTTEDCSYPKADGIQNMHPLDLVPSSSNNMSYVNSALRNSKYLKPAQQLLDEFVCVGEATGCGSDRLFKNSRFTGVTMCIGTGSLRLERTNFQEINLIYHNQCLSEENSVSNSRIRKLLALLDELDSRYKQYCHQIEEVMSSFDVVVGTGAAISYTGLTIQAMSRHFSSIRDAIVTQIHASRDPISCDLNRKSVSISQPSLFEQRSKQHRTLQNLAMIQVQQVWKPLRGLPENSVAILRAWLFEHFLHPYPNDKEKQMLASRTGLTRNQISNWFINARVRLWKPMIEEMYREEFAEASGNSSPSFQYAFS